MNDKSESNIKFYGTTWCGDTIRARNLLDKNKILYTWIDIDVDKDGEQFVKNTNKGYRSVPTIVFPDGNILVEPSDSELLKKIQKMALI